jgi:hypothetical protein
LQQSHTNTNFWDQSQIKPTSPNWVLTYLILNQRGTGPRLTQYQYLMTKISGGTEPDHKMSILIDSEVLGTGPKLFKPNYLMPDMVYIHENIMGPVPNYVSTHCFTAFGVEPLPNKRLLLNFLNNL